jgi:3-keto-5-aminohexanoate cleavage enzyme
MTRFHPLPRIMVAPNGARRGKADHPALPVTIAETVATARACHAAGADALHAHIRDADGAHMLDAGLYAELIAEMARALPDIPVQITTEAAGRYSAADQRRLLTQITPEAVSIALAEMLDDGDTAAARRSYHALAEAGVAVQHILYDAAQVAWLADEIAKGTVPARNLTVLYVLGRYTQGQISQADDLLPFLDAARQAGLQADWGICAFGPAETDCLVAAHAQGGKMRIGFENNLIMADGRIARDNAERVAELVARLR